VTQLERLKKSTEAKVLFLTDRIVLVIVALRTIQRQAQKRLASVFDKILLPRFVIPLEPAADKISRRGKSQLIVGHDFIRGQHLNNHAIVALVGTDRTDDPVTPTPDHRITVHDVGHRTATIPIAVTPDVHPVTGPPLAISGRRQKPFDHALVRIRRILGKKVPQLVRRRWHANQVEIHPPQQNLFLGGGQGG